MPFCPSFYFLAAAALTRLRVRPMVSEGMRRPPSSPSSTSFLPFACNPVVLLEGARATSKRECGALCRPPPRYTTIVPAGHCSMRLQGQCSNALLSSMPERKKGPHAQPAVTRAPRSRQSSSRCRCHRAVVEGFLGPQTKSCVWC